MYSDEMQGCFDMGDTHIFYGSLKVVFGPNGKSLALVGSRKGDLVKDKALTLFMWSEHFSDLLNQINHTDPGFIDSVPHLGVVEELDFPPTLAEVGKEISSLKCLKSASFDYCIENC